MTAMRDEALSCGARVADFLKLGLEPALEAGRGLRRLGVQRVEMLGRGSSGHAGTVLRYAFAQEGSLSVSAVMPSIAASDHPLANMRHAALVAISQSGRSPDLVRYAQAARAAGATVVSLVNSAGSPLGATSDMEIALHAGPEVAVAATKSVVLSVVAGLAVVAGFGPDDRLLQALCGLPSRLDAAGGCDWSTLTAALPGARAIYVVGRGADFGVAKELALKLAETVGIPALAFSSAEFLHGPVGAASPGTPVIGVVTDPRAMDSVATALVRARGQGAPTLLAHGWAASAQLPAAQLSLPMPEGSIADSVLTLLPAYLAIEAAAVAAGRDPDRPGGLSKVTETW